MDIEYDFKWMIEDIDNSMVFMLYDSYSNNCSMASYQVRDILTDGIEKSSVKIANVDDLTNFINLGRVRFVDVFNNQNVIEIPISKLSKLYTHGNEILSDEKATDDMYLSDIGAFCLYDGKLLDAGYAIKVYKVNDPSESLEKIMEISSNYANLGMQEKFNALATLDSLNHQKKVERKR